MPDYKPPKRFETATQRDLKGQRARAERDHEHDRKREQEQSMTFSSSAPHPVEDFDDLTGRFEGEELQQRRAKRPTDSRMNHLERKHDILSGRMARVETGVANIEGKMEILPELVSTIRGSLESMQKEDHLRIGVELDVGKAKDLAEIESRRASDLAKIEAQRAADLDVIAAKRASRRLTAIIVAAIAGVFSSGAFVHWLLGKL